MTLKRMFVFLIAAMFILPIFIVAEDDFEDDEFGSFEEDEKAEPAEPFDAEESAEKKKEEDKEQSDAAMRDLLGDEEVKEDQAEDEETKDEKKVDKKKKKKDADEAVKEEKPKKVKEPVQKGFKPVILVKGGFTLLGQYKEYRDKSNLNLKYSTLGTMFGSVDEGLLGAEFIGDHVLAKGTMNVRTLNPFITKGNNPLAKANLHAIQDGFYNGLYEIYGGLKFFDVFIKAGSLIPEYGLLDTNQTLGMGFSTPFLTRSLIAVEGFIPETDEGFALGYKGTFADEHTILVGFMLGTGSVASDWWESDKTMGIYGRLGYMHEYFQAAFGFQYRTDYFNEKIGAATVATVKNLSLIGIGVHLRASIAGFEMPFTFDYTTFGLVQKLGTTGKMKSATNILISAAPGYAYSFDSEWADKISIAVRFDFVQGVYAIAGASDYLDYDGYKSSANIFRIGATANFFVKEMKGIHSYAGITFLMQPERKIVGAKGTTPGQYDYGFMTLMLSAGAEM